MDLKSLADRDGRVSRGARSAPHGSMRRRLNGLLYARHDFWVPGAQHATLASTAPSDQLLPRIAGVDSPRCSTERGCYGTGRVASALEQAQKILHVLSPNRSAWRRCAEGTPTSGEAVLINRLIAGLIPSPVTARVRVRSCRAPERAIDGRQALRKPSKPAVASGLNTPSAKPCAENTGSTPQGVWIPSRSAPLLASCASRSPARTDHRTGGPPCGSRPRDIIARLGCRAASGADGTAGPMKVIVTSQHGDDAAMSLTRPLHNGWLILSVLIVTLGCASPMRPDENRGGQ